jgi:hypothetical protein
VCDQKLPSDQRIASLTVLVAVDGPSAKNLAILAGLMNNPATPPEAHRALLQVLAAKDYEGIEPLVIPTFVLTGDDAMATTLRDWLTRHRKAAMLAPLVRAWADADPADEIRRQRYIQAVEAVAGRPWREALLEAFNAANFDARGSAWELLLRNTDRPELIERLGSTPAATPGMAAIQYYLGQLGYLPRDRQELLRAVVVFSSMRPELDRAVPVAQIWAKECGYSFHPRDVHLLANWRGEQSPLASQAQAGVVNMFEGPAASAPTTRPAGWNLEPAASSPAGPFAAAVPVRLSVADRIRMVALADWLGRGVNTDRLAALAALRGSEPAGGLIVCGQTGLGTIFYPCPHSRPFVPSEDMIRASRDCVAWLIVEPRALPAGQEVGPALGDPQARLRDCPALLIIRQGNELHAMYWTPGAAQCVELAKAACK